MNFVKSLNKVTGSSYTHYRGYCARVLDKDRVLFGEEIYSLLEWKQEVDKKTEKAIAVIQQSINRKR